MRAYISNADLAQTLERLVSKQDEKLMQIYKEVVSYRFIDKKKHPNVDQMLFVPTKALLYFINILLSLAVLALCFFGHLNLIYDALAFGLVLFCLILFFKLAHKIHIALDYLYIDEMFSRKILVLCKKESD